MKLFSRPFKRGYVVQRRKQDVTKRKKKSIIKTMENHRAIFIPKQKIYSVTNKRQVVPQRSK